VDRRFSKAITESRGSLFAFLFGMCKYAKRAGRIVEWACGSLLKECVDALCMLGLLGFQEQFHASAFNETPGPSLNVFGKKFVEPVILTES
jgi:hypothetical protein